jgi:hypothetical protein
LGVGGPPPGRPAVAIAQNAAGNLRDERRIVRERETHRLGESAFDVTTPQLGDRRRGAGRARGDFGRPGKLPNTVGAKMPKGIVPGLLRAGGAELLQQFAELGELLDRPASTGSGDLRQNPCSCSPIAHD